MILKKMIVGPMQTNTYLIIDDKTNEAAIIDPGFESENIINEIENAKCKLKYILLTHAHFDHAFEAQKIKDKYKSKFVMNKKSVIVINDEKHNLSLSFFGKSMKLNIDKDDILLDYSEEILLGQLKIKMIEIAGHTIDSSCYYIEDEDVLFTGDTLFRETIGRTDFFGGDYELMINNIKSKLLVLPEETKIYTGHGPDSTINHEKMYNEYLKII